MPIARAEDRQQVRRRAEEQHHRLGPAADGRTHTQLVHHEPERRDGDAVTGTLPGEFDELPLVADRRIGGEVGRREADGAELGENIHQRPGGVLAGRAQRVGDDTDPAFHTRGSADPALGLPFARRNPKHAPLPRAGMDVSVIGTGYVGTTLSACLADVGHDVTAIDIDEAKVEQFNDGDPAVHEPGLQTLLDAHLGSRLRATTGYDAVPETDVTFITVGTPSREDGSIDLSAVEAAAADVGAAIAEKDDYHLVTVKSTVVPGAVEERIALSTRLSNRRSTSSSSFETSHADS